MTSEGATLRDRRRAELKRSIQVHALRLFTQRGYDATTVADVSNAAGVSPITVYRHFPTKEDLVLWGDSDLLIAQFVAATPAGTDVVRRVGRAMIEAARALTEPDSRDPRTADPLLLPRLKLMIATPALRARHLDQNYVLQREILEALQLEDASSDAEMEISAAIGACLAAMHVALERWAAVDGEADLASFVARALVGAFGDAAASLDPGPGQPS